MPIDVTWWGETHTIMLWTLSKPFDMDDYNKADQQAAHLLADISHEIYTVFDLTPLDHIPAGFLPTFPRFSQDIPDNQRLLIMVIKQQAVKRFAALFSRIYHHVEFVHTLDEALTVIKADQNDFDPT